MILVNMGLVRTDLSFAVEAVPVLSPFDFLLTKRVRVLATPFN